VLVDDVGTLWTLDSSIQLLSVEVSDISELYIKII
jgi:hypothetical protein